LRKKRGKLLQQTCEKKSHCIRVGFSGPGELERAGGEISESADRTTNQAEVEGGGLKGRKEQKGGEKEGRMKTNQTFCKLDGRM